MKIRAGRAARHGKLKIKNPKRPPASNASTAAVAHCREMHAAVQNAAAAMNDTPPARPSMLSRKFTAFTIATMKVALSATESHGPPTCASRSIRTRTPPSDATPIATAHCTSSFGHAGRARRSSIRPMMCNTAAPMRMAQAGCALPANRRALSANGGSHSARRSAPILAAPVNPAAIGNRTDQVIATPPMLGIGRSSLR